MAKKFTLDELKLILLDKLNRKQITENQMKQIIKNYKNDIDKEILSENYQKNETDVK